MRRPAAIRSSTPVHLMTESCFDKKCDAGAGRLNRETLLSGLQAPRSYKERALFHYCADFEQDGGRVFLISYRVEPETGRMRVHHCRDAGTVLCLRPGGGGHDIHRSGSRGLGLEIRAAWDDSCLVFQPPPSARKVAI